MKYKLMISVGPTDEVVEMGLDAKKPDMLLDCLQAIGTKGLWMDDSNTYYPPAQIRKIKVKEQ